MAGSAAVPAIVLGDALCRADIPVLCARLAVVLHELRPDQVVCDANALHTADAVAVEALARLQLTAVRHGCRIRLHAPSQALRDLLELTGLAGVLG